MTELNTTPKSAQTLGSQEQRAQGGPVELSMDQLKHVAGGGFILSERVQPLPRPNGFILSE